MIHLHSIFTPTLVKYINREYWINFLVYFFILFAVFFVNQVIVLIRDIVAQNVGYADMFVLVVTAMPFFVFWSLPLASLMASFMVMRNFSIENALVAMTASGISLIRIFVPMLFYSIIMSVITFFVGEFLIPYSALQYSRLYQSLLSTSTSVLFKPYEIQVQENRTLITGAVDNDEVKNMIIIDNAENGNSRVILAKRATLITNDEIDGVVSLELDKVFSHDSKNVQEYQYTIADSMEYNIVSSEIGSILNFENPTQMSSLDLYELLKENIIDYRINQKGRMRARLGYHNQIAMLYQQSSQKIIRGQVQFSNAYNDINQILAYIEGIYPYNFRSTSYTNDFIEFWIKFAIPLSSISFTFLAVPVGIFSRRTGKGGILIGLLLCGSYFGLLMGARVVATEFSEIPSGWIMWLPNMLYFIVGLYLLIQKMRV